MVLLWNKLSDNFKLYVGITHIMSSKYGKIPKGRVSQMQSYLRQGKWFQLFLEEAHWCLVFFLTLDHQHQQFGLGPGSVLLRTLSKDGKYFNRIVLSSRFQRVAEGIFCSDCCIHPGREYVRFGDIQDILFLPKVQKNMDEVNFALPHSIKENTSVVNLVEFTWEGAGHLIQQKKTLF